MSLNESPAEAFWSRFGASRLEETRTAAHPSGTGNHSGGDQYEVRLSASALVLIQQEIERRFSCKDRGIVETSVCREWLRLLAAALGEGYYLCESKSFLYVMRRSAQGRRHFVETAERGLVLIRRFIGGKKAVERSGKGVILAIESDDKYYRYLRGFYSRADFPRSAGVCIQRGCPHVVINKVWNTAPVLIHELVHYCGRELEAPRWIEEGVAELCASDIAGQHYLVTEDTRKEHFEYWNTQTIQGFWSGAAFDTESLGRRLSYELARILLAVLQKDLKERALQFYADASREDAGESSAQRYLGCTLSDIASIFLGPGSWEFRSRKTAQAASVKEQVKLFAELLEARRYSDARAFIKEIDKSHVIALQGSGVEAMELMRVVIEFCTALSSQEFIDSNDVVLFLSEVKNLTSRLIEMSGNSSEDKVAFGAMLSAMGESDEALQVLTDVIQNTSEAEVRSHAYYERAAAFERTGDLLRAWNDLLNANSAEPESREAVVEVRVRLLCKLVDGGEREQARYIINSHLLYYESPAECALFAALLASRLFVSSAPESFDAEVIALCDRALLLDSENLEISTLRAGFVARSGKNLEALATLKHLESNAVSPEEFAAISYHKALALWGVCRYEKAREELAKAISLDPNSYLRPAAEKAVTDREQRLGRRKRRFLLADDLRLSAARRHFTRIAPFVF